MNVEPLNLGKDEFARPIFEFLGCLDADLLQGLPRLGADLLLLRDIKQDLHPFQVLGDRMRPGWRRPVLRDFLSVDDGAAGGSTGSGLSCSGCCIASSTSGSKNNCRGSSFSERRPG